MAADSQLKIRDKEGLCHHPHPQPDLPKENNLDRKQLKRTLRNCDKDAAG